MPEGDTLFKIARFIDERASGQELRAAALLHASAPYLIRRQVLRVYAHGKHVFIALSPAGTDGFRLRVHLGMFGSWHHYPPGAPWQRPSHQARVVLDIGAVGQFVCFLAEDVELLSGSESIRPPRGRGSLGRQLLREQTKEDDVQTQAPPRVHPAAWDDDLDAIARAILRMPPTMPLVDILLHQQIAAGFGNVYKSELLFLFGWSPTLVRQEVDLWMLLSLFARGRCLLQQNIGGWARTTTVDRRRMRLPHHLPRLWVYNRAGSACLLCQSLVVRQELGRHRRSTYHCPTCQPPAPKTFALDAPQVPWRSHVHIPLAARRGAGPVRGR